MPCFFLRTMHGLDKQHVVAECMANTLRQIRYINHVVESEQVVGALSYLKEHQGHMPNKKWTRTAKRTEKPIRSAWLSEVEKDLTHAAARRKWTRLTRRKEAKELMIQTSAASADENRVSSLLASPSLPTGSELIAASSLLKETYMRSPSNDKLLKTSEGGVSPL